MSTASLSEAAQEGPMRAAAIITGEHGDEGGPGDSGRPQAEPQEICSEEDTSGEVY